MKNNSLLEEFQLSSAIRLRNKIVMAPMTRNMADLELAPTSKMAQYYARRATAGLLITEGIIIRPDSRAYTHVPGLYTRVQIDRWKKVTHLVHDNGGKIFAQLWHVGRVSHPSFLDGQLPISPSETEMSGSLNRSRDLFFGKSRAVSQMEIQDLVESYAEAAKNAMTAGFDGVEIHGANGYLIDQFLHYSTNHRSDEFGGNPTAMARFPLAVVQACGESIGYSRVGLRLSPGAYLNQVNGDPRDADVFIELLESLNRVSLAYLHTGNFDDSRRFKELNGKTMTEFLRSYYRGHLIGCGGYSIHDAEVEIRSGKFDLIAFGRPFIANPDLVDRIQHGLPLNPYDPIMLQEFI